ncbi:MAG: radical SAM protein [Actinomycetota bacterium]|nr:radical SAM protein [Actinomycetota bacterium]
MSRIYGPVSSWRLGRSLGIDLLSTKGKTCTFDCIYCQLGGTEFVPPGRKRFVETSLVIREFEKLLPLDVDYITFSGMGEPTLATNLGEAIGAVKEVFKFPVAVLTNSSLIPRSDVREELALADVVVAKLDAPSDDLFHRINRPLLEGVDLRGILKGLRKFRGEFAGKLALQMMFIDLNRDRATELAELAGEISPDEVQINTPLRPCGVEPLLPGEIEDIRKHFRGLRAVTVYEAKKPPVIPYSLKETLRRRPHL